MRGVLPGVQRTLKIPSDHWIHGDGLRILPGIGGTLVQLLLLDPPKDGLCFQAACHESCTSKVLARKCECNNTG